MDHIYIDRSKSQDVKNRLQNCNKIEEELAGNFSILFTAAGVGNRMTCMMAASSAESQRIGFDSGGNHMSDTARRRGESSAPQ